MGRCERFDIILITSIPQRFDESRINEYPASGFVSGMNNELVLVLRSTIVTFGFIARFVTAFDDTSSSLATDKLTCLMHGNAYKADSIQLTGFSPEIINLKLITVTRACSY
nr:unnamed protein product [Haemonchus contortus]